ncbi:helix-turn-helix domain-containing protein [Kingella kingae]|uniref:winged helix-turn-helix transcriptional regulator n=1 Tax=Kingella kingae TaxID=504 RepID=UPI000416B9DA|nr:helix-turn-helix domain-containing protein [Kingella kingae]MDK4545614.1 helix-turn-helix domain-containing protein [Kingella kingae]MDK4567545.1 helix-turn-helix domain-containing protein [Kingella kingae]MDK4590261.1 helix-turn-helix domain-containing protein [Kingella kingae]MDK4627633.1 helix-turn-helix domain-containing protein [Kingella kingae]MDK4635523.1 helix-turn-helix domain-containing protein [Kingella kingae]
MEKGNVLASACPSREILRHLTSRWGVLVLIVLQQNKPQRFSELRRSIEGVSERMLTETLKNLEQDGMVVRQSFQTVPPHVEYSLTDFGKTAADKLQDLVDWLENNLADILATHAHAV